MIRPIIAGLMFIALATTVQAEENPRSAAELKRWLQGTHWEGGRLITRTWTFLGSDYIRLDDDKKFKFRTIDSTHFKVKWNSGLESTMELNDTYDQFTIRGGHKTTFKKIEKKPEKKP
ncbi:MAG: hypothetical protein AAF492_09640 [Verrucomicrobiota bacterium]